MPRSAPFKICFVCLGNICRSPLAQGVFEDLVRREGLEGQIQIGSAGTGGWHVGDPPDARMQATARENGIQMTSRARQFQAGDFQKFDLVLAMDQTNEEELRRICPNREAEKKLKLFRDFDPKSHGDPDVPDPYYGGDAGFDNVFNIVQRACPEILRHIRSHLEA